MNLQVFDGGDSPRGKAESTEDLARVRNNNLAAITERLKTGRNDSCPCGSGRKYKRCCLVADETYVREAAKKIQIQSKEYIEPGIQQPRDDLSVAASENLPSSDQNWDETLDPWASESSEAENLWCELETLTRPTSKQMDIFLEKFLALPPGETDWCDLFHFFASNRHNDLPSVFRRMAAMIPHTKEEGIAFFYWAVAEEFDKLGYRNLLPEVAAGFRALDGQSYDAEALRHIEDYLLASGFDAQTLELDEQFLPALRQDHDFMPHIITEVCLQIFDLRVGTELRSAASPTRSLDDISQSLRRGMEEELHEDVAASAATVISGQTPMEQWRRSDFDLVIGNLKSVGLWRGILRLNGTLIRAAREAWQIDQVAPGGALTGLTMMLDAVYALDSKNAKRRKSGWNLLSYLNPSGIEKRTLAICRGLLEVNLPLARRFLQAHDILCRLAERHQLISNSEAEATKDEICRLYSELEYDRFAAS